MDGSLTIFTDGQRVLTTRAEGSLSLFDLGEEGLKKLKNHNDLEGYAANAVLAPGEMTNW